MSNPDFTPRSGSRDEMPFGAGLLESFHMGLADGPTEVHKVTLSKQVLRGYTPSAELWPDYDLILLREAAVEKSAGRLGREIGTL